jgi:uncharacterized membrane protein YoaK (UPF0700 family)
MRSVFITEDNRQYRLAMPVTLAVVAGYVDTCTFLAFAGFFVAQATGSFVVVGSELFNDNAGFAVKALAIPVFILAGMLATAIVRGAGERLRGAMAMALALEAALLCGLAFASIVAGPGEISTAPALFGLAAMGIQSATVRLLLASYASTNVMTSNTTQLAIEITDSIRARKPTLKLQQTGSIMLGFLGGIALGALAYRNMGLVCLVLPIVVLVALAVRLAMPMRAKLSHQAGGV